MRGAAVLEKMYYFFRPGRLGDPPDFLKKFSVFSNILEVLLLFTPGKPVSHFLQTKNVCKSIKNTP